MRIIGFTIAVGVDGIKTFAFAKVLPIFSSEESQTVSVVRSLPSRGRLGVGGFFF